MWWVRSSLADFKAIKNELGGTVNDVVLTVVSGALGRWLRTRGVRTEGLELRALVPVSIRAAGTERELGNQIAAMRGPLPVYATDPIDRLEIVKEEMGNLKQSKQALGAEVISGLNDFAPPTLLAQASRLNFSTRLFNLIVTNVPGPQFPLYLLGRELQELAPVAFLPEDHALAVAVMSYNGCVDFGLLGDYDAMPDIDVFADYIEDALAELMQAAGVGKPTTPAGRAKRPAAYAGLERSWRPVSEASSVVPREVPQDAVGPSAASRGCRVRSPLNASHPRPRTRSWSRCRSAPSRSAARPSPPCARTGSWRDRRRRRGGSRKRMPLGKRLDASRRSASHRPSVRCAGIPRSRPRRWAFEGHRVVDRTGSNSSRR